LHAATLRYLKARSSKDAIYPSSGLAHFSTYATTLRSALPTTSVENFTAVKMVQMLKAIFLIHTNQLAIKALHPNI